MKRMCEGTAHALEHNKHVFICVGSVSHTAGGLCTPLPIKYESSSSNIKHISSYVHLGYKASKSILSLLPSRKRMHDGN